MFINIFKEEIYFIIIIIEFTEKNSFLGTFFAKGY